SQLSITVDRQTTLPLVAILLLGHAALTAAVLRDPPMARRRGTSGPRIVLELMRLPATRYLAAWYAVAFGGLVTYGVYLPAYLQRAHEMPVQRAVLLTAACLTLAALCRPLGGWLCRHERPVPLLC